MVGRQDEGFFTGLSDRKGTKPGKIEENEAYLVRFEAIQCENVPVEQSRFVKDRFESCYRWTPVMELILECLEYYYDEEDFQIDLEHTIRAFLGEYEGWGMLFALLPQDFQKLLLVLYSHINVKNLEQNIQKSYEEVFEELLDLYENETQGMPLSDLIPKVNARLLNIVAGPKEHERRKILKLHFMSSRFQLIANFSVEKKRVRRSLVEHAAEAVANNIVGVYVDTPDELEIPETLKPAVQTKLIDVDWIASYYYAKRMAEQKRRNSEAAAVTVASPDQTKKAVFSLSSMFTFFRTMITRLIRFFFRY